MIPGQFLRLSHLELGGKLTSMTALVDVLLMPLACRFGTWRDIASFRSAGEKAWSG